MPENNIEQLVLDALADDRFLWRTTQGVASQLGVNEGDVLEAIEKNEDQVVQSSVPSIEGAPLFTTKEHFHEKSSTFEKIVGAFKGKIR